MRKELKFLKFDSEFTEIKIRHAIIIYLIDMIMLIPISVFILVKSDGQISSTNTNILCLLSVIFVLIMLIYRLKPSRKKMICLYNDFKDKIDTKEITYIFVFLICLSIGGTNIITDIIYLISPSLANNFIQSSPWVINTMDDYYICFIISVILSPIVDEITFRNILFKRLSKKFNIYVGLIVSSIIFSAFNICPEIVGVLVLAVINCILYVKYENIIIPILVNAVGSFIRMLVIVPINGFGYKPITMAFGEVIISLIIGAALFAIGSIFFIKFINKNKSYLKENYSIQ